MSFLYQEILCLFSEVDIMIKREIKIIHLVIQVLPVKKIRLDGDHIVPLKKVKLQQVSFKAIWYGSWTGRDGE